MTRPNAQERRRLKRRNVNYYMPVVDNNTQQVVGHLVDISAVGLMMDSKVPIPTNLKYSLRLDLMENIAGQGSLILSATSIWCRPDAIQPYLYNAGFEIKDVAPQDMEVLKIIAEKYGSD